MIASRFSGVLKAVLVALTIAYPFAIYFGSQHIDPALIVGVLAAIWLGRFAFVSSTIRSDNLLGMILPVALFCIYVGWVWLTDNERAALYYPIMANAAVFWYFASSLRNPPSVIERIARLQKLEISPEGIRYMRTLTKIWCALFLLNIVVAFVTATWADRQLWMIYNGFIAYILMGVLFFGELVYRPIYKRRIAANDV